MIRKLSILYGTEQILVAGISMLMILTLSTTQYVTAHLIVSWSVAGTALIVAFIAFRRDLADLIPGSL